MQLRVATLLAGVLSVIAQDLFLEQSRSDEHPIADAGESPDQIVERLTKAVETDPQCAALASNLRTYAKEQLALHQTAIRENLVALGVDVFDIIWPGAGYDSVACGGQYEVLSLLEKDGILKVGKLMGSSGGAASAILSVADDEPGAGTLLKYYMVYAKWAQETWDPQILRETPVWESIYRRVVEESAAFSRVRDRGWVAAMCGVTWSNSVFYNFTTRAQCAEAFYASGDLSFGGLSVGTTIDGLYWKVGGSCSDGGGVTYFPHSAGALLYYHSRYGHALKCTMATIEYLVRQGVDETIKLLMSTDLRVDPSHGKGGMRAVLPGPSGFVTSSEFAPLKAQYGLHSGRTWFYDIDGHKSFSH